MVHWAAVGRPAGWDRAVPTLFLANHSNWWDGLLAFLVTRAIGLRFQVLMDWRQLSRYRTFRAVGALPLRRDSARHAYEDLLRGAATLRPGGSLWIFPQGARRPPREPIANCERGAAEVVRRHAGPLRICPVAFRYGFTSEQLPEAFALVGDEWIVDGAATGDRRTLALKLERRLAAIVDDLDARLDGEALERFEPLVRGRLSINKRLDRFRHAVGLLDGPFEARNG